MNMKKKKLLIEEDKEESMVSYKLGIFVKKEAKIIDLDSIIKLKNLKSLDEFTSAFSNENELKIYLFNKGLLSKLEMKQNIVIMYKNNGKIKKIPVVYHDASKLLDTANLRYKLKSMSDNAEFLEKLANYYSNGSTKFNKQALNVSDIRTYLSSVRDKKAHPSKLLDIALDDLFVKAVFKVDKKTGVVEVNYRGLRDLALFIYKFESDLQKNKPEENKDNESWTQGSLFDMVQNESFSEDSILSSHDEPDFPPNSEEEARYKAYVERLDELSDKNIDPYDEFYGTKRR